jgi:HlyD family secretion protein
LAAPATDPDVTDANTAREVRIRAPVSGRVLKIHQESEAVVKAGTPLVDIGDPRNLEVVADLLSTDAVRIEVGAPVQIVDWGGPPINGRVESIDPAGFKKISALGIEELRVRTIIALTDPEGKWSRLGHEFRVNVKIMSWNAAEALKLPVAALFRTGDEWAVFAVRHGNARVQTIKIGHRNNDEAEVRSGLTAGDMVVLHPSDRISDGDSVTQREVH